MTEPAPTQLPVKHLFRLDGRTILISGGVGAVGTTVAKAILESGGDVVLLDRVAPTTEAYHVLSDIAKASDTKVWYHQVEVQDEASITTTMNGLRLRHPIRGFVSCAAISGESDACDYSIDVFRKILNINISGTFLMARAAANEMHKANVTGSIVLIASMSGHVSNRGINTSPYNASKAAVHQLARSLAAEWGHAQNTFPGSTPSDTNPTPSLEPRSVYPPIRVNTLSPGHIETPISEAARVRGLTDEWAKQNMLGRISQPEEYRAAVLFLLGEGSSFMTGADLRIDGGHCAW
ncbi:short chain dehydrogenase [Dothidotthia symphoricarpi CBS 119687]|uniref:Short chain dehydrogenase n=1 Tax=Dothidotthia symphoricarpi CBS 119687 TaxID=1392245 RepID=A0A6A6A3L9_9PLEO|nr:short chain dehydrogenase [Dothidotthia symphoricarpi CBS 119687]KAF2125348.1 short chain dehydrogenase [Dothidotthia symphoricarpi CBS 119687]